MGALQFLKYRNFTLPWNQRDRMKFRNVVHYLIGKGIVITQFSCFTGSPVALSIAGSTFPNAFIKRNASSFSSSSSTFLTTRMSDKFPSSSTVAPIHTLRGLLASQSL